MWPSGRTAVRALVRRTAAENRARPRETELRVAGGHPSLANVREHLVGLGSPARSHAQGDADRGQQGDDQGRSRARDSASSSPPRHQLANSAPSLRHHHAITAPALRPTSPATGSTFLGATRFEVGKTRRASSQRRGRSLPIPDPHTLQLASRIRSCCSPPFGAAACCRQPPSGKSLLLSWGISPFAGSSDVGGARSRRCQGPGVRSVSELPRLGGSPGPQPASRCHLRLPSRGYSPFAGSSDIGGPFSSLPRPLSESVAVLPPTLAAPPGPDRQVAATSPS